MRDAEGRLVGLSPRGYCRRPRPQLRNRSRPRLVSPLPPSEYNVLRRDYVCLPAKLLEEKCDFQRSMANNEAKLRENESDLRAAQKNFADMLDTANATYSRNRYACTSL